MKNNKMTKKWAIALSLAFGILSAVFTLLAYIIKVYALYALGALFVAFIILTIGLYHYENNIGSKTNNKKSTTKIILGNKCQSTKKDNCVYNPLDFTSKDDNLEEKMDILDDLLGD